MTEELEQMMRREKFPPNSEQLLAIDSSENSVVSAGAGAGKTAVLSWRFLRLVMEKGVRPEEILTLTFTQKAASEMRDRIYRRLLLAGSAIDSSSLESFSRATISTLDSFCSRIARSDAVSYGLARDIGVLDDMSANAMYERLALEFLADEENSKEAIFISSLFLPNEVMEKFFLKIARSVTLTGSFSAENISRAFFEDLCRIYQKQRELLAEGMERLEEIQLTPNQQKKLDTLKEMFEGRSFTEEFSFGLQGTKKGDDVSTIVNTYINPVLKTGKHYKIQDYVKMGSIEPGLLQIALEKYARMINDQKRRLGLLTFNDIAALAVTILRDNLEVRRTFRNQYRYIMIDEFQDNNSLQRDLLFLLSERDDSASEAGRIPSISELSPDKIFLVGDEKQSIYRFRGADVSVFRSLQDDVRSNGQSLSLKINYRSQKKLIDHFNNVFESVFENNGESYEARYERIEAGRGANGTTSRIVFAVYNRSRIESSEDEELDGDILEAEAIGDYCLRVLTTDEFLIDGRRPLPQEVAILFRSSGNQMNIEKALRRRGLPYQLTETRSLMLEAVAGDFYAFLQYLLYPEDRRSYIALLKSPFCALCEESICNLLLEEKDVLEVDRERFASFSSFLSDVKEEAFRLTIPDLLEKL
ncbi:MAG: UvrD-helicase domain-containing protein, partial [Spirochaetales bacterium]|nr:UvrD-helicase domain-containing protein [Spirochaetales bacterium]